jgi:hypothetical protein
MSTFFLRAELLNCCIAATFVLVVTELYTEQSSMCKNEQRAITPKLGRRSYGYFALQINPIKSIYLLSFVLVPSVVSKLCPRQEK